jgi:hypothetical protein
MQSSSATVALLDSSFPALEATLAIQRPKGLRLRAKMPLMFGSGLDVGSNDEVFWLRHPNGIHQSLLFARHDEFQRNMLGSPIPVPPPWIIEALGLVHIDPELITEGPLERGDGQVEVRTRIPTASGNYQRVLLVDATGGFVRDQYIYEPGGSLVARATGADHRFYSASNVVLPHSVRIYLEPTGAEPIGLSIEVGGYALNQLLGSSVDMFEMPTEGNVEMTDLGRLRPILPPATMSAPTTADPNAAMHSNAVNEPEGLAPGAQAIRQYVPTASYVPAYRGVQMR